METRCPICWLAVVDDVFECPGCATPQHAACVASAGGCVVVGCTKPAAAAPPGEEIRKAKADAQLIPGNPDRWMPGRMLDALWISLAVLPELLVVLVPLIALNLLPQVLRFIGLPGLPLWILSSVVLYGAVIPALILLTLEPELRRTGLARLKDRVLDAYLRYLPVALPSLLLVMFPMTSPSSLILWLSRVYDWGTAIVYTLVGVFALAVIQVPLSFALVLACLPREVEPRSPMLRALSLLARRPLSAFGALLTVAVIPGYLSSMVMQLMYFTIGRMPFGALAIGIYATTVGVFILRIWPIVYLCLLHRDLTAREK